MVAIIPADVVQSYAQRLVHEVDILKTQSTVYRERKVVAFCASCTPNLNRKFQQTTNTRTLTIRFWLRVLVFVVCLMVKLHGQKHTTFLLLHQKSQTTHIYAVVPLLFKQQQQQQQQQPIYRFS
jgi:hypothetical protein